MEVWEAIKLLKEGKQVRNSTWKKGLRLATHQGYVVMINDTGKTPFEMSLSDFLKWSAPWEEYIE